MRRFVPNTILITGATGGIGSVLATTYAAKNKTLILTGRNEQRLQIISEQCEQKGATVIQKALDLTDHTQLSDWLNEILATTNIDLVIANAGISSGTNEFGQFESLQKTIDVINVNLIAMISTIYPVLKKMQQQGRGQIALMSSLAAFRGLPHSPAYCASKAAVRIYGESLRALVKKYGVYVSIICPGFVKSPMSDSVKGPKPYLILPDAAAKIIKNQLAAKRKEIIFPKQLKLSISLLNVLPKWMADNLLLKVKSYVNDAY
jgi:short-subunit dehydrogenase